MSIGVIVGLAVSAAIIAIAAVIGRMSRPGPVYPGPGSRAAKDGGGADSLTWMGATTATTHSHHGHSDGGFHTGGSIGGHDGGFHAGGFDGGGSDGGGGGGGGGD